MWALVNGRLWLMHQMTDAPIMLGLVTLSSLGPILLLSIWGGVLADRVNRLRLVTRTRGAFAALAVLTGVLIAAEVIEPWHLIAISFATGVLLSFDIPSRQALLPGLVPREHLRGAIALYAFATSGSAVLGPSVFALVVNSVGLEGLFYGIGIAYALTVGALAIMKPVERTIAPSSDGLWQEMLSGFRYLRGQRPILMLIGMGIVVGVFGSSYQTLLPIFADEVLGGGIEGFSRLLLGSGAGALAGALMLAIFGQRVRPVFLLAGAGTVYGAGLVIFAQLTWFPAAVGVIALVGVAAAMYSTMNSTLVQTIVDDRFRGRVMSIHQWTWGVAAFGGLFMGALAQAVDAPFALTVGGMVTAAVVAVFTVLAVRGHSRGAGRAGLGVAARDRGLRSPR